MRRLARSRTRKRHRRYEMAVLLQRQIVMAEAVRIRPAKRIFRPTAPFHL
jgi:hypothetical protein